MHRRLSTSTGRLAIIFLIGIHAPAQEVITGPRHWYFPEDEGAQLPQWKRKPQIDYPKRLKGSGGIFYVISAECISQQGKYQATGIYESGSQGLAEEEVVKGYGRQEVIPAKRDGREADARVWEATIFNPASAAPQAQTATAHLLEIWPAFVPWTDEWRPFMEEAFVERMPRLLARIRVTVQGMAEPLAFVGRNEPDETTAEAARAAIARWKFEPARKDGQVVESELELPVILLPLEPPEARNDWPPEMIEQVPPNYPDGARRAGLKGEVKLGFIVDEGGRVSKAQVLTSNNPEFDRPALKAVLQWKFKPARHRGRPVKTRMMVPIAFQINDSGGGDEAYSLGKIDQTKLPPEFRYDQPPRLIGIMYAVYPRSLLERKIDGRVEIKFIIEPDGRVGGRQVVSATHPELAQAANAMLDASRFDPARKKGLPTRSALGTTLRFKTLGDGDVPVSSQTWELLALVKKQRPIAALKDLDSMPKARSQRAPVFPTMLQGRVATGEAQVEFYIDEDGTVLLPQAVSASAEEFGYAAAQAVSQWLFEPPRRAGKPVLVRAQVPFDFKLQPAPSDKKKP